MPTIITLYDREEVLNATGLSHKALSKYEEFGFVQPWILKKKPMSRRFYSEHNPKHIKMMQTFLDGKHNLRQAYEKAREQLDQ